MADSLDLPTVKQLAELAPAARGAYAIRAAQRVAPLYQPNLEAAKRLAVKDVDTWRAVVRAVRAMATFADDVRASADEASAADARAAAFDSDSEDLAAGYGASAAVHAASVAHKPDSGAEAAVKAASSAFGAAAFYHADRGAADVVTACRRDYFKLSQVGRSVANVPTVLASLVPLWPEGEPNWFGEAKRDQQAFLDEMRLLEDADSSGGVPAEQPSARKTLQVTMELPDGIDRRALIEIVKRVSGAADDLHRAHGGHGLTLDEGDVKIETPANVPVPGGPA